MRPRDVYALTGAADPRISPDGTRVAYQVWSIDEDANDYRGAISFASRVRDAAYDQEEDEKRRAPRRVTRLFYKLDSVGWTTDRRKHIFVVDVDGGEPRQVTDGDCEDDGPAWTPDGSRILFTGFRG